MKIGLCIGDYCPLHQGHLDSIMRAKKENQRCLVVVCDFVDQRQHMTFDLRRRTQLVREFFMDDNQVVVMGMERPGLAVDRLFSCDDWRRWFEKLDRLTDSSPSDWKVYVQSEEQARNLAALGLDVVFEHGTSLVSDEQVRQHPLRHWHGIASTFRPYMTKNILVIGTASEGKTTLIDDVAKYFDLPRAVEWGRVYMEQHALRDEELTVEDFSEFLTGQVRLYQEAVAAASRGVMLADTDNLVTLMYALAYVKDPNIALTQDDYDDVLRPLAWSLRKSVRWERIFVMVPGGEYVDDGLRYMGQSSMDERMSNHNLLMSLLREFGLDDRVTYLQGGAYYENYITLKTYINELLAE